MIVIQEQDCVYTIKSKYDPNLIPLIKLVPGYSWNPKDKLWSIPKDKLGWLLKELDNSIYSNHYTVINTEDIGKNDTLDATPKTIIPDIDISKVPFYVAEGCKPLPHQLDFMRYAIDRQQKGNFNGFLLGDEPGLTKTISSANLALYNKKQYKLKHCLVICNINSSKYNWRNDIRYHTNRKVHPYILGSRLKKDGSLKQELSSSAKYEDLVCGHMYGDKSKPKLPYFIILNIEAVRYKVGKKYMITERLIELMNKGVINMVIIDEIHKNASPQSCQGKQLIKIKSSTKNVMWLPLSGTPIVNKPTDAFLPTLLIGAHSNKSYYMWCKEFCVYGGYNDKEIVAYKNIPKLKTMLQGNMLRRLSDDVLDLPERMYHTEYVENSTEQMRLYTDVLLGIRQNKTQIVTSNNPLSQFIRLRQVNGSPEIIDSSIKIDSKYLKINSRAAWLMDKLEEIIDQRNEKVIIFSNWVEPLRTIYKLIKNKYKICTFTGTMNDVAKEENKKIFQTDDSYKVLLGTIGAAGTTHTFTAANNVIFYDEPWTPTDKDQAMRRAYRVGTTKPLHVYTVLSQGTIDEKVHDIIYTKEGVSNYIVDNKLDLRNNPKLFDMLLSDTLQNPVEDLI